MTEEQQEAIGEQIDRIRTLIAGFNLPLPPQTHVAQSKTILTEIQAELRTLIVTDGAEDWWEGRDAEIK